MECTCIDEKNALLLKKEESSNTKIGSILFLGDTPPRVEIRTYKADPKNRKAPAQVIPAYCPLCGEKYPEKPDRVYDGPNYVDDFREVWELAREESQRKGQSYWLRFDHTWYIFTLEDTDEMEATLEVTPNGMTLPFDWDRLEAAREAKGIDG